MLRRLTLTVIPTPVTLTRDITADTDIPRTHMPTHIGAGVDIRAATMDDPTAIAIPTTADSDIEATTATADLMAATVVALTAIMAVDPAIVAASAAVTPLAAAASMVAVDTANRTGILVERKVAPDRVQTRSVLHLYPGS